MAWDRIETEGSCDLIRNAYVNERSHFADFSQHFSLYHGNELRLSTQ